MAILAEQLSDKVRKQAADRALSVKVQNATIVVLQLLVARGKVPRTCLENLKLVLLVKLQSTTRLGQVTLQNRLLHLLHSTIVATPTPPTHRRSTSITEKIVQEPVDTFDKTLAQAVIEGISSPRNRPVLQNWVDFVLITSPLLKAKPAILQTICDCFSLQLKVAALSLRDQVVGSQSHASGSSDAEVVMLLSGLDRLLSLITPASGRKSEDGRVGTEGGSGIFGLVSGVFVADATDEKVSPIVTKLMPGLISQFRSHGERPRGAAGSLDSFVSGSAKTWTFDTWTDGQYAG